jgi:leukotriene-A4 hydrolase
MPRDPNTLSNYDDFRTKHTTAVLEIDFEKKVLKGNVALVLESLTDAKSEEILLDTRFVVLYSGDGQWLYYR